MIDWIKSALAMIDGELGGPTVVRAILFPLVISWCWTQATKGFGAWDVLGDTAMRWGVRLAAFLSASIPGYLLWPQRGSPAALAAVALGLASPILYTLVVRIAVHFWPWLDGKLSARPEPLPPPSNDFHQGAP